MSTNSQLEAGDRVLCKDGKFARVRKVLRRGAIVARGQERWHERFGDIIYTPTLEEIAVRAAVERERAMTATLDSWG